MSHEPYGSLTVEEMELYSNPDTLTLECGCEISNVVGKVLFNYYDGCFFSIRKEVDKPDNVRDYKGRINYWFGAVDCSRTTCQKCGIKFIQRSAVEKFRFDSGR